MCTHLASRAMHSRAKPSPLFCADDHVPSSACTDLNADPRASSFKRYEMKRDQGQVLLRWNRPGQVSHERPEPLQTASPPLSALRLYSQLRTLVCRAQQVYVYCYCLQHRSSSLLFMPAVLGQPCVAMDFAGSILAPPGPFEQKLLSPSPPHPPLDLHHCRLGMLRDPFGTDSCPPESSAQMVGPMCERRRDSGPRGGA